MKSVDKCSGDHCICAELAKPRLKLLSNVKLHSVDLIQNAPVFNEIYEVETTRDRVFREREEYMAESARLREQRAVGKRRGW